MFRNFLKRIWNRIFIPNTFGLKLESHNSDRIYLKITPIPEWALKFPALVNRMGSCSSREYLINCAPAVAGDKERESMEFRNPLSLVKENRGVDK